MSRVTTRSQEFVAKATYNMLLYEERITTRSQEFAAKATNSESHRSTRCQEVGGGFNRTAKGITSQL